MGGILQLRRLPTSSSPQSRGERLTSNQEPVEKDGGGWRGKQNPEFIDLSEEVFHSYVDTAVSAARQDIPVRQEWT